MNPLTLAFRIILTLAAALSSTIATAATPNPPFPIGNITVTCSAGVTGKPELAWNISLPPGSGPYNHFIKQTVYDGPHSITYYLPNIAPNGMTIAPFSVMPGGARFELWTVAQSPFQSHLLASTFVGPSVPSASLAIRSQDPYPIITRTRADHPFHVDINIDGLISSPDAPVTLKSVNFIRHSQTYGPGGTGENLNRYASTLISSTSVNTNGLQTHSYPSSAVPSTDPLKKRGEERFSIWSVPHNPAPGYSVQSERLADRFVQVWPVADGSINGLDSPITVGSAVPEVTITLNDLYPKSTTWTRIYKGQPQSDATGTILPGTTIVIDDSVPHNRVLKTSDYASAITSGGLWTIETVTETPFGIDRITAVTFPVQGPGTALEQWRQTHFGTTTNTGDAADQHDFDHDGIPNLVEFAFALHPKQDSSGQLPTLQTLGENQAIIFTPPPGVEGVTYGAQWSTSLAEDTWADIPDTGTPPKHIFIAPVSETGNLFLRLKVIPEP